MTMAQPTASARRAAGSHRRPSPAPGGEAARVLHWNQRPAPEVRLTITGSPGIWSFRGLFPCGAAEYVLLVPYAEREQPGSEQRVVPAADVLLEQPAPAPTTPANAAPPRRRPASRARA